METIKKIETEADELCKWLSFLRQKGRDAFTGEPLAPDFHPHHFIHRRQKRFRWDLDNVFAVNKRTHFWIHSGGEGIFGATMRARYPERIERLLQEKNKVYRWKDSDTEKAYLLLRTEFQKYYDWKTFHKLPLEEKFKIILNILGGER
jgi:hypothetical protein